MRIPFVHHRNEGELMPNGISWMKNKSTRLSLTLRLGRFIIYFRWRSPFVTQYYAKPLIFEVNWFRKPSFYGVEYEFDTQSFLIDGVRVSTEFLHDVVNPDNNILYQITRNGNNLRITQFGRLVDNGTIDRTT